MTLLHLLISFSLPSLFSYSPFSRRSPAFCWLPRSLQCQTLICHRVRTLRPRTNTSPRPPRTEFHRRPSLAPFKVQPRTSRVPRTTTTNSVPAASTERQATMLLLLPASNTVPQLSNTTLPVNNTELPQTLTNNKHPHQLTTSLLRAPTDHPAADMLTAPSAPSEDIPTEAMRTLSQPSTPSNTPFRIIPRATISDTWSPVMETRPPAVTTSCCPMAGSR